MKDDDPEKRIRELERELADMNRPPQSIPPYTSDAQPYTSDAPPPAVDAPYTATSRWSTSEPPPSYPANPPYAGNAPYVRDPTWGADFRPPRRRSQYPWVIGIVVLVLVPPIYSIVAHFGMSKNRSNFGSGATASTDPSAVPQGGELRVGGISDTKTLACNDGKLTLDGHYTDYSITGHCASLTVAGYNNHVTVDSADTLESTGHFNTVTVSACNNGNVKLSADAINFMAIGHCASVTISSLADHVTVDSVDSINVSGDSNVVTYHSGTPKITDSGHFNKIQRG